MSYILPTYTRPIPNGLNLVQFIQTVITGVSGLPGTLVRPKWQIDPPKNPELTVNWIGFGITQGAPDANSYVGVNQAGATTSQRQENLEIECSLYGPDALEVAGLIRDGFQIQTNLDGLRSANMGFVEVTRAIHVPDLVHERWVNRYIMSIHLRREIQRVYPILTLLSASGTIHTVLGDEEYLLEWNAETREDN